MTRAKSEFSGRGIRSQREVARLMGVSHATIATLERSAIQKICDALDLPNPYVRGVGGKWVHEHLRRGAR